MKFAEAFELMKAGNPVKLPSWGGYWAWDEDKKTIMMHCREKDSDTGKDVMDIRESQRVEYTLSNIMSDEWILATPENTPIMGGVATFGFDYAIKYLKRGMRVARKGWNGKGMYIFLAKDIEFHTDADLSEFNPERTEEPTEQNAVFVHDALCMRTAQRDIVVGWLASQSDMLADDWCFVD